METRFAALYPLVIKRSCGLEHFIGMIEQSCLMLVRCGYAVVTAAPDLIYIFILRCSLCNKRHIVRRCIMVFIVVTVRIYEMRILTAKFFGAFVHHPNKGLFTACNMFGDHYRRIITRNKDNSMQKIGKRKFLAHFKVCLAAVPRDAVYRIFRDCDHIVKIAFFTGKQHGHYLCHTCRVHFLIGMLAIEHSTCFRIYKCRSLRHYIYIRLNAFGC